MATDSKTDAVDQLIHGISGLTEQKLLTKLRALRTELNSAIFRLEQEPLTKARGHVAANPDLNFRWEG